MISFRSLRRRFAGEIRGNVASLFALAAVPAALTIGVAVDYSRAASAKTQLQDALDSAALAGAAASPATHANITAVATQVFLSHKLNGATSISVSQPGASQVQVTGTLAVDTSFMRIVGINSVTVNALSATRAFSAGAIEVALALDNTGSMVNDMPALKQAASNLANALFNSASGNPNFRMSITPFVAVVNPGKAVLEGNGGEALDLGAQSRLHGAQLESGPVAWKAGCTYNWTGSPPNNPGNGGTGASLPGEWSRAARFAFSIFGVSGALGAAPYTSVTPNTTFPLTGAFTGPSGQFVPTGFSALPAQASTGWCDYLYNPDMISVFDLYARIPATTASGAAWGGWKGCVMARPGVVDGAIKDYDVTDDEPTNGDADSRFVPYFAPDEPDPVTGGWSITFNNSYLPDGVLVNGVVSDDPTKTGGWQMQQDTWARHYNLFKYNGVNRADIVETAPNTKGPNRACPDEVLPLTNDRQAVLNKIASLNYWNGAGTIVSEGFMWAWRTLSPNKPYATALPYTPNNQKVLVLMSDGKNELAENARDSSNSLDGSPIYSDYTAYGYLRYGRFQSENFSGAVNFLDSRLQTACANAKAKGVTVYTVLFREASQQAVDQMRQCASQPGYAFTAVNGADLAAAFGAIGSQISKLRLVR